MSKGELAVKLGGTENKRRKLNDGQKQVLATPKIFAPFRSIGLVSPTDVPFTSVPLGNTTFQITTSVGRCLHTYDLRKGLNLVFLSRPQTPRRITASCAWKDRILAAWSGERGNGECGVWVFKRGKKVDELETPPGQNQPLKKLFVFGSWIVGCSSGDVYVWKSSTYEHYTTIVPTTSQRSNDEVLSGEICGLPTFLNKIFVGRRDGAVDIWNLSTGKLVYTILPPSMDSGAVSALEPTPALSMIAIGREDGSISIHDVLKDQPSLRLNNKIQQGKAVISISFRTDGLGAGKDLTEEGVMATAHRASGDVYFWDLNNGGKISGILYGAHDVSTTVSAAEGGGVNKIQFLPGQDVMISTGLDNSLKSWIFDANSLSHTPRMLHQRSGHASPITRLMFVPSNSDNSDTQGKWLLSAGRDHALWGWSLRKDGQSVELSQGSIRKKARKLGLPGKALENMQQMTVDDLRAPDITDIACSLNRDAGMGSSSSASEIWTNSSTRKTSSGTFEGNITSWESIVTAHRGDKYARTWYWGSKRAGRWAFESGDGTEVSSVAITSCGTFALVGSRGGSISMFNLQSGMQRQRFPSALTPSQARKLKISQAISTNGSTSRDDRFSNYGPGQGKHGKAVTGIMVDNLNQTVISCSLDGKIKFWDFTTGRLLDEIDWFPLTAIISARYYRSSDLLAVGCDDLSIRVVDTQTKKTVRELWGSLGQINDFCFSNDGRWIVASSMDSILRVWDLPSGHLINATRLDSQCTAMAFSDTGEFLATAHANAVGVNLWNNRALFTHVPTRPLAEEELASVITPTTSGEHGQTMVDAAFQAPDEENVDGAFAAYEQDAEVNSLDDKLQSLSLVPKSRWLTLLHLDAIKQRNKPIEPPKAPEKAPFFLPSLESNRPNSSSWQPTEADTENGVMELERSRISKMDSGSLARSFTISLHRSASSGDFAPLISQLSEMSPSSVDFEIRSINIEEFVSFVRALTFGLRQRKNYELMQTWMAVFLQIHGESIGDATAIVGLRGAFEEWKREQLAESQRLADLVGFSSGVIGFLRSVR